MSAKVGPNRIITLNIPVEHTVQRVLAAVQVELKAANQSETLTRIVLDWWLGKSTPTGHIAFPTE